MTGYDIAKKYLGLQEVKDNKQLRALFHSQSIKGDLDYDPATTAWCALYVNFCEREAGHKGTGKANARSFLEYGTEVDFETVKEGDIVIFTRGGNSWQGHVAYFVDYDDEHNVVTTLGGNQSDCVCYGHYDGDNVIGFRRP